MRDAVTVLEIIRERGRRGLPLERVYRCLFNPDLYLLAYGKIYRNAGAMTPGTTSEIVDGMNLVLAATLSAHDSAWLGVHDPACLGEQLAWGQRLAGTDAWRVTAHAWPAREEPGTATAGREQD